MKKSILAPVLALLLTAGWSQAWTALCDACGGTQTCSAGIHEQMAQILKDKRSCLQNTGFDPLQAGWADTKYSHDDYGDVYVDEEYECGWSTGWDGSDCYGDTAHGHFVSWPYGCAADNVQGFYGTAYNKGAVDGACYLARGLHFLQDVANPFHSYKVAYCQDNGNHGAYEGWVAANWESKPFKSNYINGINYQAQYNLPRSSATKKDLCRSLAENSRAYISYLVTPSGWPYPSGVHCNRLWDKSENEWATCQVAYYAGSYSSAYIKGSKTCP